MSWKVDDRVKILTACAVSLGLGSLLTLSPRQGTRLVGWEKYPRLARVFGAADLVVGTGLLVDEHKARWMFLRAYMDAVIACVYALILVKGEGGRMRPATMTVLMGVLSVLVYLTTRSLQKTEGERE